MPASPYDDPEPRGWRLVIATLRAVIALQCWGAAARKLHGGFESPLVGLLIHDLNVPETAALAAENAAAYGLLVIGLVTLYRPVALLLLLVSAWAAADAGAGFVRDQLYYEPAEQAVRVLAPLSLMLMDFWPPRLKFALGRASIAVWLLRIGAAATFIGHGLEALQQSRTSGPFVDLIIRSAANAMNWEVSEETALYALAIIGGVDIGLGLNLLLGRFRSVALYMAFWGFVTALARMTALGPGQYFEFLLRAANGGVPFVIFLYWWKAIKEFPAMVLPDDR